MSTYLPGVTSEEAARTSGGWYAWGTGSVYPIAIGFGAANQVNDYPFVCRCSPTGFTEWKRVMTYPGENETWGNLTPPIIDADLDNPPMNSPVNWPETFADQAEETGLSRVPCYSFQSGALQINTNGAYCSPMYELWTQNYGIKKRTAFVIDWDHLFN